MLRFIYVLCKGCIWTEWEGIGMCSEACGIGNQEFTRKQSPWGVKTASDCKQTERKKEECILTGCSGKYFNSRHPRLAEVVLNQSSGYV